MNMKKILIMMMALLLFIPTMAMAAGEKSQPTVSTPAADLRSTLDQLLSEHYVLAVMSMTKKFDGAEDAEQVQAALNQNAKDMTPAIESVYGKDGAAQFEEIFLAHNSYTDSLVEAAKSGDENARKEAEAEVQEFVDELSAFLGTATEGNLPEAAAKEALRAHEDDVMKTFDLYTEGKYEEAYTAMREGYARMFTISKALSTAIVAQMPEKFENTKADTPAAELRSNLNMLASEHFALAAISMQKGFDGAEDYDFATWAEDMHTADFKAAIVSIYGEEGGAQFEKVWQSEHITAQADLAAAAAQGDEEGIKAAKESLGMFSEDFGAFLGAATEENLPTADAQAAVKGHEDTVISTFDSYAAKDYDAAYTSFREGYAYMYGVGEALGGAIVKQMPDKFMAENMPSDMPKTGMGGAADNQSLNIMLAALAGIAALTGAIVFRKKAMNK
ncbi:copper amine oxidase [Metabacillus sp. 113a]|uniref:copper amine oxidase n=1 Tax=Metabacillus sp. 113a TaxID=3404706 RepID=UPI003CF49567